MRWRRNQNSTVSYRYFAVVSWEIPVERAGGVIRTWITESGLVLEETFSPSLTWEMSRWLSPMNPPNAYEFVEVTESVAERIVQEITATLTSPEVS